MDDRLRLAELKLLFALDALLRERNVTRAAQSLGISQPALSADLASLRRLFGDQLLIPAARGLVPTPRALGFEQPLRQAILDLGSILLREQQFDPATAERTFVIAATDFGHHTMVAPLTRAVRQRSAAVKLVFVPFGRGIQMAELEAGRIDIVVAMRQFLPDALKSTVLLVDRHVVLHRVDHPRGTGPLSLDEYCRLEHVIVSLDQPNLRTAIDEQLNAQGLRRNVVAAVPGYGAIADLVQTTDMVATVLGRLADSLPGHFVRHPLPLAATEFLYAAAWHPRHHDDPGHRWLRDTLVATMARGDIPR